MTHRREHTILMPAHEMVKVRFMADNITTLIKYGMELLQLSDYYDMRQRLLIIEVNNAAAQLGTKISKLLGSNHELGKEKEQAAPDPDEAPAS